jgi:hypothetical protein
MVRRDSDEQVALVRDCSALDVTALPRPALTKEDIYSISVPKALRAKLAARDGMAPPSADRHSEFPALERYLLETIREMKCVRLNLFSPIRVLRHLVDGHLATLKRRLALLDGDARGIVQPYQRFIEIARPHRAAPTTSTTSPGTAPLLDDLGEQRARRRSGRVRSWGATTAHEEFVIDTGNSSLGGAPCSSRSESAHARGDSPSVGRDHGRRPGHTRY